METSGRTDRCPYIARSEMGLCRAHHAVSLEPNDVAGRLFPPTLTCRFLTVGVHTPGEFYPRCAIGDASARQLFVERRRNELDTKVTAALAGDPSSEPDGAGLMVVDDDGRFLAVNGPMWRMLGYESEDMLLGKSVWDLTPEPHGENGRAIWRDFIAAGESFGTYRILCADGSAKAFDYIARAAVIPGLHVSILTPARPGESRLPEPTAQPRSVSA